MKRIVVAGATGVVLAAVALFAVRSAGMFGGKGWPTATVTLSSLGGVCHADVSNDLGGSHNNYITWVVTNTSCPDAQFVSFTEYREYLDVGYGPVDPNIVDPDRTVTPNAAVMPPPGGVATPVPVTSKVKFKHYNPFKDRRFKYKVCVGTTQATTGSCNDPDLDVWPF